MLEAGSIHIDLASQAHANNFIREILMRLYRHAVKEHLDWMDQKNNFRSSISYSNELRRRIEDPRDID